MSIQRLEAPRFQTLQSALGLSKGSTIDGIEGLNVLEVNERKEGGGDKPWTCQALKVSDGTSEGWMSVFDFPDISHLRGRMINIESTMGGNKKVYGVTIDVYQNKGKLKLSNSALIDDTTDQAQPDKQAHNLEAHGVGGQFNRQEAAPARNQPPRPSQGRQNAPERPQTQPARQQQPIQQGQTTVKRPIHGATVGMSVNQANAILLKTHEGEQGYFGSPAYSAELFELASDILRVSQYMESGHLAPTTKQRAGASREMQEQEVAHSRPARQPREQAPAQEDDTPPIVREEQSYQDEMADEALPF